MTGQNDRQDESLTGQVRDQAGHCLLDRPLFSALLAKKFDRLCHATALHKKELLLNSKLRNTNEISDVYCLEKWRHFGVV